MYFILIKNTGYAAYVTVKAAKKMAKADIVCYDAHTDTALLDLVPETCVRLNGKRALQRFMDRYEPGSPLTIVRMTEERDSSFRSEMHEFARFGQLGFALELIPGISNINLFSANAQFALTARNQIESFWVWDGSAPASARPTSGLFSRVARTSACIILLNPDAKASGLIELLCHYRDTAAPVVLVSRGGAVQRLLLTNLRDIGKPEWRRYHLAMIHSGTGV